MQVGVCLEFEGEIVSHLSCFVEHIGLYILAMTLTTVCGATLMLLVGAGKWAIAASSTH